MDNHLHIVTLDVPLPADYGGAVEMFYKIKALHRQGVKIYLHCFTKGRPPQTELNNYCESVNYYQRIAGLKTLSLKMPYIVKSRSDKALLDNLNKDDHPVLLDGIHGTYYLNAGSLGKRKVMVRLHNAEFKYYSQLARNEKSLFKKLYFIYESRLLYNYEKKLATKTAFIALNKHDVEVYQQQFNAKNIEFLPAFIPHTMATGKEGKGCYCLYHGNLSVNENEAAVTWLLEHVFNTLKIPFVIAGKNPSEKLKKLAHLHQHTCIVANPGEKEMQDMIAKAQVHVLPSFNNTGIKLKLLNALFNGRHCLVNAAGVEGSGLENACHIATDAASFKDEIAKLYEQSFTEQEKEQRQGLLQTLYNNEINARELIRLLNK